MQKGSGHSHRSPSSPRLVLVTCHTKWSTQERTWLRYAHKSSPKRWCPKYPEHYHPKFQSVTQNSPVQLFDHAKNEFLPPFTPWFSHMLAKKNHGPYRFPCTFAIAPRSITQELSDESHLWNQNAMMFHQRKVGFHRTWIGIIERSLLEIMYQRFTT